MRHHIKKRPIPTQQSVHWKPLHDPHYVVASLQPAGGGRVPIFIRQRLLAQLEAVVRRDRRPIGLLLGNLYTCPVTDAEYLVIESATEPTTVHDENRVVDAVAASLNAQARDTGSRVLGWFRGAPLIEAKPSMTTAAVHVSYFSEPWQTTLVIADGSRGTGGAFFLHDKGNATWFLAPFYELPDHAAKPGGPKSTVVSWPEYITAEEVMPAPRESAPPPEVDVTRRAAPGREGPATVPVSEVPQSDLDPLDVSTDEPAPRSAERTARTGDTTPLTTDRPVSPVHEGLLNVAKSPPPRRPVMRRARRVIEKLSIVDDRDQVAAQSAARRRVDDIDDTVPDDDPARYIELARSEGFFIAARFDPMAEWGHDETLWVLNEPFSGLLLVVVTTPTAVVDATLHYNLQTDDAGLQKAAFPEHRDSESKTIYVRETCIDSLRARCRRLRATNALLKEWKVTPPIPLLTPAEWQTPPTFYDAPADRPPITIGDLMKARIAELPEGVRDQFHLRASGGAHT